MSAALIVFAVFFGLSLCIGTVATSILIANGKLTLPRTNMRRVALAKVDLEVARMALERESLQMRMDDAIHLRLERSLDSSSREPQTTELIMTGANNGS